MAKSIKYSDVIQLIGTLSDLVGTVYDLNSDLIANYQNTPDKGLFNLIDKKIGDLLEYTENAQWLFAQMVDCSNINESEITTPQDKNKWHYFTVIDSTFNHHKAQFYPLYTLQEAQQLKATLENYGGCKYIIHYGEIPADEARQSQENNAYFNQWKNAHSG